MSIVSGGFAAARAGDVVRTLIYGRLERCEILAVHRPCGTIDVQRLSDGRCFRVSGLPLDGAA